MKILTIQKEFADRLVSTMCMMYESQGKCFGVLGVYLHRAISPVVHLYNTEDCVLADDMNLHISNVYQMPRPATDGYSITGNSHPICNVILNESVFCFQFPGEFKGTIAVTAIYAHYHLLKQKYSVEDDQFCDMLLMQVGQWQKKFARDNDIIANLAQKLFKPELVR